MGQGANRDQRGACLRIVARRVDRNPARSLDRHGRSGAACPGGELLGALVVDQDMRHARGQRRLELGVGFHLDDHRHVRRRATKHLGQRVAVAAEQRPMVVLPQDRRGQRGAVFYAAADCHGVQLEPPQPGRRFSRVCDPGGSVANGVHRSPRERRDARQVLQEVQRHALAAQQCPRGATHGRKRGAGLDRTPLRRVARDGRAGIKLTKYRCQQR